jgi:hypothetical protein
MKFTGKPPELTAILGTAWYVFGDGEIDTGSDERLKNFLLENNVPKRSLLFLNSPGGNLLAGMKLGKVIREWELLTQIGKISKSDKKYESDPGECYSACALAFLGGEYRFYKDDSEYGVHRFYSPKKSEQDIDVAQIISAIVVQYIRDMGVDPELFSFMSRAGSAELVRLTRADMERLRVLNDGIHPPKWTIESIGNGLYLKGERETWRGINKFMIMCAPSGEIILYVVFDPENRGEEVIRHLNTHSLIINGDLIPVSNRRIRLTALVNGWINAYYSLDEALIQRIASAGTVGITMQMAHGPPIFFGFDGMEFSEGRQKLPGLLNACRGIRRLQQ